MRRGGFARFAFVMLVMLAGCSRPPPAEMIVKAESPVAFNVWLARFAGAASPDERAAFEEALQEIRLRIMTDREATGSGPISDALRDKIHGRRVREVRQIGLEYKRSRLRVDFVALETVMRQNAMLQTREGDVASENYLGGVYRRQNSQLEALEAELASVERELAPLFEQSGRSLLPDVAAPAVESPPARQI